MRVAHCTIVGAPSAPTSAGSSDSLASTARGALARPGQAPAQGAGAARRTDDALDVRRPGLAFWSVATCTSRMSTSSDIRSSCAVEKRRRTARHSFRDPRYRLSTDRSSASARCTSSICVTAPAGWSCPKLLRANRLRPVANFRGNGSSQPRACTSSARRASGAVTTYTSRSSSVQCVMPSGVRSNRSVQPVTHDVTASPPICWRAAKTSVPRRNSSVTGISQPR